MSRVQEIALSGAEMRELRAWLDEYEDQIWDQRLEAEVAAGKWDALAARGGSDVSRKAGTPFGCPGKQHL